MYKIQKTIGQMSLLIEQKEQIQKTRANENKSIQN
jgi:hypothetical protein